MVLSWSFRLCTHHGLFHLKRDSQRLLLQAADQREDSQKGRALSGSLPGARLVICIQCMVEYNRKSDSPPHRPPPQSLFLLESQKQWDLRQMYSFCLFSSVTEQKALSMG